MYSLFEYTEYMKTYTEGSFKQYTIRNIPLRIDQLLRKKAKTSGKSFNQVVVETLIEGTGKKQTIVRTDLDFLIGSMTQIEASVIEEAVQTLRSIDKEIWNDEIRN